MRFDPYADPQKPPRKRQLQAYDALDREQNLLVVLPTSYGKTNIALYLAQRVADQHQRFMLAAPLKALVEEHFQTFNRYFPHLMKLSGDYRENRDQLTDPTIAGYIMTFETIYQLFLKSETRNILFNNLGGLIIDEAHLIGSERRGAVIESLIYLVRLFYPQIRLLLLSATIGNPISMATHFDLEKVIAKEQQRPIPLKKDVIVIEGINEKMQRISLIQTKFISMLETFLPKVHPRCLAFCQSRDETEKLAEIFAHIAIASDTNLLRVDFHHAGRKREDKLRVESLFRAGSLDIIFCTPTLAMGINMPCDIVIVTSVRRWNPLTSTSEIIPSSELIQMIGRAGRPGQQAALTYGQAFIYCNSKDSPKISRMIQKPMHVHSQISTRLEYMIITWISAGVQTETVLQHLYDGIFVKGLDPNPFFKVLKWLQSHKFIRLLPNSLQYQLLSYGSIVVKYAVDPYTVIYLHDFSLWFDSLTNIELDLPTLFSLLLGNNEFCDHIQINKKVDYGVLQLANRFMQTNIALPFFTKMHLHENWDKIQKGFVLLFGPFIKQRYFVGKRFIPKSLPYFLSVNRSEGDFTSLLDDSHRILLAAKELLGSNPKLCPKIELLWKGLEGSVPLFDADLIRLLYIPTLTLNDALFLHRAGIIKINDLIKADVIELYSRTQKEKPQLPPALLQTDMTLSFLEHLKNQAIAILPQLKTTICSIPELNPFSDISDNISSSRKSTSDGFCIFCGIAIDFDIHHPFCPRCHKGRSFRKEIFGVYCHKCGKKSDQISSIKPLDYNCWMQEN
jgi:superfamily II DNA or RNA helicase